MAAPRCLHCENSEWTADGRCSNPDCKAFPTLGYQVADLIEAACAIPDGDLAGDPFVLPDEQLRFFLNFYRVDPSTRPAARGRWVRAFTHYRGAQICRPQKWGKGPISAAWICGEAHPDGPVRFDGWDAAGQPVGRPWPTPHLQVTGVSEDQTDNVWRALVPMIELGSMAADIPDTGKTRINLPSGGLIEPVTASAISRLGQRITGAVQDQTESWTASNRGRQLADNQRRGLGGMGGRFLETPNAWDPTEDSVAQQTNEGREPGVYIDDVEPGSGSVRNKTDRRRMLRKVYGNSGTPDKYGRGGWVDLDRIDGECEALVPRDPAQAERWYLNRKRAGESVAVSPEIVKARTDTTIDVPKRSLIVVGVDGARFVDGLGMVATVVEGPSPGEGPADHQFPLGIWERPESAAPNYEHPFDKVDGAMIEAFELYDVWRVYVDPQYIEHLLETWQGRWGKTRVLPWLTNRPKQAAWMIRNYVEAWGSDELPGDLTHNGDPDFVRHMHNARRQKLNVFDDKHRQMFTLSKESPDSRLKMDAAMAGGLSWEARGDCISEGKPRSAGPSSFVIH